MENALSASDVALLNNGGEWGGNSFLWIFALLILANGGFGLGNNARSTESAIADNEILSGQKFESISRQVNQIGDGICSSTYALNNSIKDGNAGVANTVVNEGRALQTQLSECCCSNARNVDALRYDIANFNAATNANVTAQTQKILDKMAEDKIASLTAEVSELKTQNMFCGIPRISNYAYGVYPYSTGCGCNAI